MTDWARRRLRRRCRRSRRPTSPYASRHRPSRRDPTTRRARRPRRRRRWASTLAQDVTSPRGWIEPREPYGPAPVSPADDPTITSLTPNTAVAGVTPIWVKITGTKFTQWSTVETGNVVTPYLKYISPTRIDVLMDPRSTPGIVVVKVIDHGVKSTGSDFTFT